MLNPANELAYNSIDNKLGDTKMGLDISVIRTPKTIDLEEIYALLEAIESGYDWYLGDDQDKRQEKWIELKDKCRSLTKQDVLGHISVPIVPARPKDLVKCINDMTDSDFNTYLAWIVSSIAKHEDGNTHLNFDYDNLPGKTIFDSCSWNLYDIFKECRKNNRPLKPCGDSIQEIDPYRVWKTWNRWNAQTVNLWLAKWIGCFSERIGFNILGDCLKELGIEDAFVSLQDMKHYKESIKKVVDETFDTEDRLWLVASY